ncbi:hypothetical protein KM043_012686 [Ampulex compressa]|nr:hypothetical protein KM043_012686 [Ampulex compressa]
MSECSRVVYCAFGFLVASVLVVVVPRIPGGVVGSSVVPRRVVGAARGWICRPSWHALRFRIVQREMDGLGLLHLGCVHHAAVCAQRCWWTAGNNVDDRLESWNRDDCWTSRWFSRKE